MNATFQVLKGCANRLTLAGVSPMVVAMRGEQLLAGADRADGVFQAYSQLVSLVPGTTGEFLRRAFYSATLPSCGQDLTIGFGTVFSKQGVSAGDRVYVGMHCTLGHAALGHHVTIGSNVDILSGAGQHNFDDLERPIQDQGGTYATVAIGQNSWLGNGAVVMADVGARCVVGAGSVVTKPLPDDVIAAGNPARVVRTR